LLGSTGTATSYNHFASGSSTTTRYYHFALAKKFKNITWLQPWFCLFCGPYLTFLKMLITNTAVAMSLVHCITHKNFFGRNSVLILV